MHLCSRLCSAQESGCIILHELRARTGFTPSGSPELRSLREKPPVEIHCCLKCCLLSLTVKHSPEASKLTESCSFGPRLWFCSATRSQSCLPGHEEDQKHLIMPTSMKAHACWLYWWRSRSTDERFTYHADMLLLLVQDTINNEGKIY